MSNKSSFSGFHIRVRILMLGMLAVGIAIIAPRAIEARIEHLIAESRALAEGFEHDAAIDRIETALLLTPNDPRLHVELGRRILLIYEWDRALLAFDRAIEIDPDYADAYYFRALTYASAPADARADALRDYERYLTLSPDGEYAAQAAESARVLRAALGQ